MGDLLRLWSETHLPPSMSRIMSARRSGSAIASPCCRGGRAASARSSRSTCHCTSAGRAIRAVAAGERIWSLIRGEAAGGQGIRRWQLISSCGRFRFEAAALRRRGYPMRVRRPSRRCWCCGGRDPVWLGEPYLVAATEGGRHRAFRHGRQRRSVDAPRRVLAAARGRLDARRHRGHRGRLRHRAVVAGAVHGAAVGFRVVSDPEDRAAAAVHHMARHRRGVEIRDDRVRGLFADGDRGFRRSRLRRPLADPHGAEFRHADARYRAQDCAAGRHARAAVGRPDFGLDRHHPADGRRNDRRRVRRRRACVRGRQPDADRPAGRRRPRAVGFGLGVARLVGLAERRLLRWR